MDPQAQFCHNPDCPARGRAGLGNVRIHSRAERRYRCTTCGRTFAETYGTPFYRLKKTADVVTIVLTLLCHGCPLQAIVVAFGIDERTVGVLSIVVDGRISGGGLLPDTVHEDDALDDVGQERRTVQRPPLF